MFDPGRDFAKPKLNVALIKKKAKKVKQETRTRCSGNNLMNNLLSNFQSHKSERLKKQKLNEKPKKEKSRKRSRRSASPESIRSASSDSRRSRSPPKRKRKIRSPSPKNSFSPSEHQQQRRSNSINRTKRDYFYMKKEKHRRRSRTPDEDIPQNYLDKKRTPPRDGDRRRSRESNRQRSPDGKIGSYDNNSECQSSSEHSYMPHALIRENGIKSEKIRNISRRKRNQEYETDEKTKTYRPSKLNNIVEDRSRNDRKNRSPSPHRSRRRHRSSRSNSKTRHPRRSRSNSRSRKKISSGERGRSRRRRSRTRSPSVERYTRIDDRSRNDSSYVTSIVSVDDEKMPSRKDYDLPVTFENNSQWRSLLTDEHHRSYAGHLPSAFSPELLDEWWTIAMKNIEWKQPEVNGKLLQRFAAFYVQKGCKCRYRYSGTEWPGVEYPDWFIEITRAVMKKINFPNCLPNSCNINYYEDGHQCVGWHSDNEHLFQSKHRDCLIISLSLGASRKFQIRRQWTQETPVTIDLNNGDLMTMEGLFQRFYSHRVPREAHIREPRINFTWRWITLHFRTDGCPKDGRNSGAPGHSFPYLKLKHTRPKS